MFEHILGNEKNKEILIKLVETDRTSHSYVFNGIKGIGKKMIAKEFAKMLLCLDKNKYCNSCKSCIEFDSSNNPDFFLIEAEDGKIKIEQIREMQRKVAEKPIISSKKVYIIDDADTMTVEAQNCLLKTLEEPPEYAIIILICSNESSLLSTIKSRCTIMQFDRISNEGIKRYLKQNYNMTEVNQNMLDLFQGSIGKAIILKDKQQLYENIEHILENIKDIDIIDTLKKSEEIYKSKEDITDILEYMNVILLKLSKQNIKYIYCIDIIEDTKKRLKANCNYDMCIDNMLFNIWEEVNEKNYRS